MSEPGVIVITGRLAQRTALSIGGSDQAGMLDDAFCLDGRGRPTLRGTSLAGALLDSIRKAGFSDLPATVSGDAKLKRNEHFHGESVLRVWTSHPEDCWHRHDEDYVPSFQPRAGVGIRQDTGAAKSGALYDLEVLPPGTQWPLVVELDLWRYQSLHKGRAARWSQEELLAAIQAGLVEWEEKRCWLGRGVARGLGWMCLSGRQEVQIDALSSLSWTRKALIDQQSRRRNFESFRIALKTLATRAPLVQPKDSKRDPNCAWHYERLAGRIQVGARENGWGLDSLSNGGHQAGWAEPDPRHLVKPMELETDNGFPEKPSDMSLAMTPRRNQTGQVEWVPFVPGSGIRGSLRHELSYNRRREGERVIDPLTGRDYQDQQTSPKAASADRYRIDTLFGALPRKSTNQPAPPDATSPNSSRLLVSDAHLIADWYCAVMQTHAGDEFDASVFGSGKFDRIALLHGEFAFEMIVEAPPDEAQQAKAAIEEIQQLIESDEGHGVALGGAQWRSHGQVHWVVDTPLSGRGGERWDDDTEAKVRERAA